MFEFMRGRPPVGMHPLGQVALLADLRASELSIVDGFVHQRRYLPGEVIFDQGEEGLALYMILSGRVVICPQGETERAIAELGAGDFFGELALLDDAPRSAQARAIDHTVLAVLFRRDFERLMESHAQLASKVALQLARHLGRRLRGMVERRP